MWTVALVDSGGEEREPWYSAFRRSRMTHSQWGLRATVREEDPTDLQMELPPLRPISVGRPCPCPCDVICVDLLAWHGVTCVLCTHMAHKGGITFNTEKTLLTAELDFRVGIHSDSRIKRSHTARWSTTLLHTGSRPFSPSLLVLFLQGHLVSS